MKEKNIAIIGIACRFPGAKNYQEFWSNLVAGVNSIQEIPPERWALDEYYSPIIDEPNKSISKWCGLLDNIDQFDNRFFSISPREAKNMDPQQRLLLEETWHCIEDAGVPLKTLQTKKTSVYVGVMASDYHQEAVAPDVMTDSYAALGNYDCILANRISYSFGFTASSLSIDAACAASMVALHNAKISLLSGESDYAIVAGVSLNIHPWKYISFSKSRMLSPDGQCKTFDKDANGYVPGEGVGVLLLQPLENARSDHNHIYGLIKGSAVNHGGQTPSITAPRVEAQRDVILAAYKDADINPETVTYVEAHGTGTSLGDPIEIEALTRAFREYTPNQHYCEIGSVKTNIGHLEAAAGIAGIIKVLLMMRHRQIPPTLNIKTLNPIINFAESPFKVATDLDEWSAFPLRAGVSSFGFGGVNSHTLLESFSPNNDLSNDLPKDHLFILSAKSSNALKNLLDSWKNFVDSENYEKYPLSDICATLMTGRDHFFLSLWCLCQKQRRIKSVITKGYSLCQTRYPRMVFVHRRRGKFY
jgi:polyketide synthase PksN